MNQQVRKRLRFLHGQSPPPLLSLCSQAQFTPHLPRGTFSQYASGVELRFAAAHPTTILQRSPHSGWVALPALPVVLSGLEWEAGHDPITLVVLRQWEKGYRHGAAGLKRTTLGPALRPGHTIWDISFSCCGSLLLSEFYEFCENFKK